MKWEIELKTYDTFYALDSVDLFYRLRQPFGMLLASSRHFRRNEEVESPVHSFGRMFLSEQPQKVRLDCTMSYLSRSAGVAI